MAITAKDVMALRQRTGLGMMDCKAALEETGGDAEAAVELLRKKLKGKMDERTDRSAAEGAIAVATNGRALVMIELNAETDFAARNDGFVGAAQKIAELGVAAPGTDFAVTPAMTELVDQLRITIKENISIRRGVKVASEKIGSYIHHNRKLGVIVAAEGPADDELLTGVCQHITAYVPTPTAIDETGLDDAAKAKALAEAKQEAIDSGKPEQIAEKIALGKYKKWVDDHTLLGQPYVKDMENKKTVGQTLPKGVKLTKFVRYAVGL